MGKGVLAGRAARGGARGCLAAACLLCALAAAAQHGKDHDPHAPPIERSHPERIPLKPTLAPAFSIATDALGFSPPGSLYLGNRIALASLDFLDENRLLFTFRIPGLIRRQTGSDDENEERHIKAVVLSLPDGAVQAESIWELHDRSQYLWMLKDGHFLVRDRDELKMGDASLDLKPYLRFPGPLISVELDPTQQYLVTNSREPAKAGAAAAGMVGSPDTAKADVTTTGSGGNDPFRSGAPPNMVLRILRRDTGQVMLVSRVRSAVKLPLNPDGYLEMLPGKGVEWVINMNDFGGKSSQVGRVDSSCSPTNQFLSPQEFLVTTCNRDEMLGYVAMTTDGRRLWEDAPTSSPVRALMVVSPDGSRLARESLAVTHAVTAYSPLDSDDIKGQLVEVFDAATGKIELESPATPILDGGGNVAFSPSGRRVAVLNAGAIQVFDLPAPAAPPTDPGQTQARKSGP